MIYKLKIISLAIAFGFVFLIFACNDEPQAKKKSTPNIVSGEILSPAVQNKSGKKVKKNKLSPKINPVSKAGAELKSDQKALENKLEGLKIKSEHYNSQGKIDPFNPLIQEKPEESQVVVDNRPKRILTPLEKIELSQIRLVAVIIMKNKQIAMVEEASGKGYEVGIGTYIGKNQGRVSEIRHSSIVIKELVRDYKGRLKEHVQEIKLHKSDGEE
ncbi:MAG: pilus assembly protein PilP [Deltaproteobacteria bacterium]|nr:pilus assembly protein PilP [Deltaproteobacteria bacterium]